MKLFSRVKTAYYWFKFMRMTRNLQDLQNLISHKISSVKRNDDINVYEFTLHNERQAPQIEIVDRNCRNRYDSNSVIKYVIRRIESANKRIIKELAEVIKVDVHDVSHIRIDRVVVFLDDNGGEIDLIGRYSLYGDITFTYSFYCELDITKIQLQYAY